MKMIPPVPVDLLICADRKVAADHEAGLPSDPTVSVVSALHGKCDPEEMIAIERRLIALANLVTDGDGKARRPGGGRLRASPPSEVMSKPRVVASTGKERAA